MWQDYAQAQGAERERGEGGRKAALITRARGRPASSEG